MESKDVMKYLPQILLAIGAIVGIIAFFLNWIDFEGLLKFTGKDLIGEKDADWQKMIPLIILILGIVALIVGALPHFGVEMDSKILNGILLALGVIMIILFILFFMWKSGDAKIGDYLAIGAWLGLVAGLIPVIVGALGFAGVLDDKN